MRKMGQKVYALPATLVLGIQGQLALFSSHASQSSFPKGLYALIIVDFGAGCHCLEDNAAVAETRFAPAIASPPPAAPQGMGVGG